MIISSDKFRKVNLATTAKSRQISICSIEERVGGVIVAWLYALTFHDSPYSLGNIEVRRVRRQKEEVQSSAFPKLLSSPS